MATDGFRQFLWGLCVKMVIADNLGVYANKVFSGDFQGSTNFYGAVLFAIQIYADFASYSDMAIGLSKMLGIKLMRNFQYPYFAKDIADFWKRWHISLTTWFRDYVFLPLAYFLSNRIKTERFLFIQSELFIYTIALLFTWTLTGLWHGANVTFLAWGFIHAVLLVLHHWMRKPKKAMLTRYGMHHDILYLSFQRIYTLFFILVGWIFFRSQTMDAGLDFISRTMTMSLFTPPINFPTVMIIPVFIYFFIEWLQRDREHGLDFTGAPKTWFIRWSIYFALLAMMFFYQVKQENFIYFQF
jgi:D-alanyl-lipoteichoic acid acyltransferase DltB (MBOAT superfamily)